MASKAIEEERSGRNTLPIMRNSNRAPKTSPSFLRDESGSNLLPAGVVKSKDSDTSIGGAWSAHDDGVPVATHGEGETKLPILLNTEQDITELFPATVNIAFQDLNIALLGKIWRSIGCRDGNTSPIVAGSNDPAKPTLW